MSNNVEQNDTIIQEILDSIPQVDTMQVKLPSLGKNLYGLKSEYVTLRAMTFDDEKALLRLKNKADAVNLLIARCVEEDLDPRELISQDKIFLVVNIRNLSIGSDYNISITCGNCGNNDHLKVNVLDTFKCNYPEKPIEQEVEIELPVIKKKVVVRRATSQELEQPQEKLYDDIWRFVLSIEGISSGQFIYDIVNKLPRKDIHEIVKYMGCDEIGLDTRFMYTCSKCGAREESDLTTQPDFFTMR